MRVKVVVKAAVTDRIPALFPVDCKQGREAAIDRTSLLITTLTDYNRKRSSMKPKKLVTPTTPASRSAPIEPVTPTEELRRQEFLRRIAGIWKRRQARLVGRPEENCQESA